MLCNLVWKFIVWLSRNSLQISLLPAFIPTLIYEEAFWHLGEPLWQLHLSDFHGNFCKGMHVLFPIFLSSSFTLGKGRREISTAWWNLTLWLGLGNKVNLVRLSSLNKIFSILKRLLRACKHPPKSCYFSGASIHGPGIFHLLPEKFPGSLKTTVVLKDSFFSVFCGPQQPLSGPSRISLCLSPLDTFYLWICFLHFPFRFL